jgi:hypothetical protein
MFFLEMFHKLETSSILKRKHLIEDSFFNNQNFEISFFDKTAPHFDYLFSFEVICLHFSTS